MQENISINLKDFLSENDTERKAVEKALEALPLSQFLFFLTASLAQTGLDDDIRALAAVLLRKRILRDVERLQSKIEEDEITAREETGKQLLELLVQEPHPAVRRRLMDAVAAYTGVLYHGTRWTQLEELLKQSAEGNLIHADGCFYLIEGLVAYPLSLKQLDAKSWIGIWLKAGLVSPERSVAMSALHATVAVFESQPSFLAEGDESNEVIRSAVAVALTPAVTEDTLDTLSSLLDALCENQLATATGGLEKFTATLLSITCAADSDFGVIQSSIQCLVAAIVKSPTWLVANKTSGQNTVKALVNFLVKCCTMGDLEEWEAFEEDDDELTTAQVERLFVDATGRLLVESSSKAGLTPYAVTLVSDMFKKGIAENDWRLLYAGFHVLPVMVYQHSDVVSRHLVPLLERTLDAISKHDNPKTRWAAVSFLTTVLDEYSPEVQSLMGHNILQTVISRFDVETSPRCCKGLLVALCTYLYGIAKADEDEGHVEVVLPFVPHLLENTLLLRLQTAGTVLVEMCLTVVSALASVCEQHFKPYYRPFLDMSKAEIHKSMTALAAPVAEGTAKTIPPLLEIAIDLTGSLIRAVGVEETRADAFEVLELLCSFLERVLLNSDSEGTGTEDTVVQQTILCVSRIAEALKAEFIPALIRLLPPLVKAIEQDVKPIVQPTEQEQDRHGVVKVLTDDSKTQVILRGQNGVQNVLTIHTAAVEQKTQALGALKGFCEVLGADAPNELLETINQLTEESAEECRSYEIIARQYMQLNAAVISVLADQEVVRQTDHAAFGNISPFLLGLRKVLLIIQRHLDTFGVRRAKFSLESLEAVLVTTGNLHKRLPIAELPAAEICETVGFICGKLLLQVVESDIVKADQNEGVDKEDATMEENDSEEEPEDAIYDCILQCFSQVIRTFKNVSYPTFSKHIDKPCRILLSAPDVNMTGRTCALCLFAFMIHFGGTEVAAALSSDYLPVAAALCTATRKSETSESDADVDVLRVQAAAYGVGVVAEKDPATFAQYLPTAFMQLRLTLEHPFAATPIRRLVADCAAVALLKVIHLHSASVWPPVMGANGTGGSELGPGATENFTQLLKQWLPVQSDDDEANDCARILMELVAQNHPVARSEEARAEICRVLTSPVAVKLYTEETLNAVQRLYSNA